MSTDRARLIALKDMPAPCMGAPDPYVLSSEMFLELYYYIDTSIRGEDGKRTNAQNENDAAAPLAVVRFFGIHGHYFGEPGEEANQSHPLFDEVHHDWTCVFELVTNQPISGFNLSMHFGEGTDLRYFIFPFHDSTFEVLARSYDVKVYENPSSIDVMANKLRELSDE